MSSGMVPRCHQTFVTLRALREWTKFKLPHPWDTHYQFSIITLLSKQLWSQRAQRLDMLSTLRSVATSIPSSLALFPVLFHVFQCFSPSRETWFTVTVFLYTLILERTAKEEKRVFMSIYNISIFTITRFDSGRKHVTSNSHGFEHIDPQSRVLNYCFQ